MKIPDDPFDLVIPVDPSIQTIDGWEAEFGCYQWFYVVGARRLFAKAGIFDISEASDRASKVQVPTPWRDEYPLFEWEDTLASNQVRRAFNRLPMCFDRACKSILAICKAVEDIGTRQFVANEDEKPLQHWLKVKPAMFEMIDRPAFNDPLIEPHIRQMLNAGFQSKPEVLTELESGNGATHVTLDRMAQYLNTNTGHTALVVLKDHRRGFRKVRTVAKSERIMELIDPDTGAVG